MHLAAAAGHAAIVKALVLAGGSVEARDRYDRLPADYALANQHTLVCSVIASATIGTDHLRRLELGE